MVPTFIKRMQFHLSQATENFMLQGALNIEGNGKKDNEKDKKG